MVKYVGISDFGIGLWCSTQFVGGAGIPEIWSRCGDDSSDYNDAADFSDGTSDDAVIGGVVVVATRLNFPEIPLGKRKPLYRFFEILPGLMSYVAVALLFILSWISPIAGSVYLLLLVAITLVKAVGTAFRILQGRKVMAEAGKVDWAERLNDLEDPHRAYEARREERRTSYDYQEHLQNLRLLSAVEGNSEPKPHEIYNAIIMVAYDEGLETLVPSVEAVRDTTFPNERIIFVLGYEERGGEKMEQNARELKEKFKGVFKDFILVKHPDNLKGEIVGKGPNLTYAGEHLAQYVEKKRLRKENVIVTSLDSDNRMSKKYLDYVTYEFCVRPDRQHYAYQPISIFTNNIWEAAAPMRVIAVSNSFFNIISAMRPHLLKNFASHSQPLAALEAMDFWSKRTIVEDGHQYWRSLFYFEGKYEVVPIRVPIYQDAVIAGSTWETLKAQFVQLRRWDYGASDVAYVGTYLFSKERKVPFLQLFPKFMRLLDGHITLAYMAPIVAFGGWVPKLMNASARGAVAFNLPNVVGWIQTFASIGLVITVLVSLGMLPQRPDHVKKKNKFSMVIQWILMPVVAIVYQSAAAFYSQTRLMLGKYMERFDVTKKVVKK